MPRYRFSDFVVSPRQRLLVRGDREVPLIPRYFDLLVFLIERRHDAVHRRDIFDGVWSDVIVSDSALSQAIRTIRRALGDDSRDPRFIRTVSRHGYRFVFPDVFEDEDEGASTQAVALSGVSTRVQPPTEVASDAFEPLLERISRSAGSAIEEEEQREAAELLHALGTADALTRLGVRPGHTFARALLRDTRWDSPVPTDVPILAGPAPFAVVRSLVALRMRRAARAVAVRWLGAAAGGGLAGIVAGGLGALLLVAAPESTAPIAIVPVLALIGATCGAAAGAGVGAGLSVAEVSARSWRHLALACGGAAGGAVVGSAAQWIGRSSLATLVGLRMNIGGSVEGLVIGAAAGIGYAIATRNAQGGLAAPRGRRRFQAAATTAVCCGAAALALTVAGRPLVGGTIHAIARASQGSQATLAPLGRLVGEPDFGPVSQRLIGAGEGTLFGFGLAFGMMRRPD
jgi:DNA-binding winged helix-turn-helix (wHTH) protein